MLAGRRFSTRPLGRLRDQLHRQVLIPAFESVIKRRRTFAIWRDLELSQWQGAEEIAAAQLDRLRVLLAWAYDSCPYYRQTWTRLDLHASDLRTLEDLARWPILTNVHVREQRARIRSQAPGLRMYSR